MIVELGHFALILELFVPALVGAVERCLAPPLWRLAASAFCVATHGNS